MITTQEFQHLTKCDVTSDHFRSWNLSDYQYRFQCVQKLKQALINEIMTTNTQSCRLAVSPKAKSDKADGINKNNATSLFLASAVEQVMDYQIKYASTYLDQATTLPGPTGEENQLYCAGRGMFAIVVDSPSEKVLSSEETPFTSNQDSEPSIVDLAVDLENKIPQSILNQAGVMQAVMAQVTCALLAGNGVIVCCDDQLFSDGRLVENGNLVCEGESISAFLSEVMTHSLPEHILTVVPRSAYKQVLNHGVHLLGYVGDNTTLMDINRQLAEQAMTDPDSPIVPLVFETDLQMLPNAHDPAFILRFITERTRTINITAVGGNATLLELGG